MKDVIAEAVDAPLPGATHTGTAGTPGDGPYITFWFLVKEGIIVGAGYKTFGCVSATRCCEALCAVLKGRSADKALLLEPADVERMAGGLPAGKEYCAELAVGALKAALG